MRVEIEDIVVLGYKQAAWGKNAEREKALSRWGRVVR